MLENQFFYMKKNMNQNEELNNKVEVNIFEDEENTFN